MVCVVLADKEGVTATVTDKDLLELLTEVVKLSGERWELEEYTSIKKSLFSKPTVIKSYTLYFLASCDWQVINTTAGFICTKREIGNLLLGMKMALTNNKTTKR